MEQGYFSSRFNEEKTQEGVKRWQDSDVSVTTLNYIQDSDLEFNPDRLAACFQKPTIRRAGIDTQVHRGSQGQRAKVKMLPISPQACRKDFRQAGSIGLDTQQTGTWMWEM